MKKKVFICILLFIFLENIFGEGYILIKYQGHYGLCDDDLNVILYPSNDKVCIVRDYIFVNKQNKCFIYDINLNFISTINSGKISDIYYLYENYYCIHSLFQDLIYNPVTQYLKQIPEKISTICFGAETISFLPMYNKGYYFDIAGNIYLEDKSFEKVYPFIFGKAVVLQSDWTKGIIDIDGNILLDGIINCGWQFKDGLLPIITDYGSGFINDKMEFVYKCPIINEYKDINVGGNPTLWCIYSEGYVYIHSTNKIWEIRDTAGNIIAELPYNSESRMGFKDGLLPVIYNGKYGYIDVNGNVAISFVFDKADDFDNGFANVCYCGKDSLVSTKSEVYYIEDLIQKKKNPLLLNNQ